MTATDLRQPGGEGLDARFSGKVIPPPMRAEAEVEVKLVGLAKCGERSQPHKGRIRQTRGVYKGAIGNRGM